MEIRAGTPADVAGVLPMLTAQYALHAAWDPAKFRTRDGFEAGYGRWLTGLATSGEGVFVVAERSPGVLAGVVVATVENEIGLYVLKRYGWIHDIWVEPAYRDEGLGRRLAMEAVARLAALGVTQVRLETAIANDAARKLFERCGFRASTIDMLLDLGGGQ